MWEEMMQGEKICYVKPRRAIRRLKAADEENITAYIYGVSGCGKTELVMRYLKNRKYTLFNAGLVTVEELREIKVSKQRKTVVINSLHDMAMQNDTEEIREVIIELVEREDVWLILSGRCAVPPWLTAVRYREVFYVIGEQELLFDEDQADQYIAMTGMIFSEEQRAKEKAYCVGMPIGWSITNSVYWQMRMGQDEKDVTKPFSDEEYRTMVGEALSQMWDYLEYHVYDRWEISIQEFLMEVAIVEDFTVYMAEMITGRNDVESLLERIQWIGNFMDIVRNGSETVYKLRNQMRISMIRRLRRKYTKEQIRKLYENAGLYYQLPPYTALGFKDNNGTYVNKYNLRYMKVSQESLGISWRKGDTFEVSVEGFYKDYDKIPLSVVDGIPLTCKGNDYGVIGNELLTSTAQGRSYGAEILVKWLIAKKLNLASSFTLFKSEYRNDKESEYIASAWDNRYIFNLRGTYNLPRQWSVGMKVSCIGGAPYTPYDEEKSSLVSAWDAQGKAYYDYSKYNKERLPAFAQVDLRIDKTFYLKHCMLGFYLDLQNITVSKLKQQDVLMSTGIIENPEAPADSQHYKMKRLKQSSGTLLPTLGITFEY